MSPAKQTANKDIKVTVEVPFQVAYNGIVYGPGDAVTVPPTLAHEWREAGWVT